MKSKSDERPIPKSGGFDAALPFSRPILAVQVPDAGAAMAIAATAEERTALAALDGLVGIAKLEGNFRLVHRPDHGFNVSGCVSALVTQTCVVSLETFESAITEDVNVDFMPPEALAKAQLEKAKQQDQTKLNDEEEDPADPIIDGKIDLGALASEFLALALDPYPRKPGVHFEDPPTDPSEKLDSPFAVLLNLNKSS